MARSPPAAFLAPLLLSATLRCCLGCTYFELNTSLPGGEVVIGRTMEFGKVLGLTDWKVKVHPRGGEVDFANASGASAHAGAARYGHVGISFSGLMGFWETDGMNSEGLSIALQSQYRAEYQRWDVLSPPAGKKLVFTAFLVPWVLSSFATVQEVKDAILNGTYVVSNGPLPSSASAHWAIADALGNSMVLEYERGEPKIYDNLVGVMTNDPFYPWHVEHLNAYSWLSPSSNQNAPAEPIGMHVGDLLPGQDFVPRNFGHGFNTGGLPGDVSPPSRFVKAFYLRQISQHNSRPGDELSGWMTLAQSILNSVFIPMGAEGPDRSTGSLQSGYQSYATLRVPQQRMYAFRSYGNMQWHVVDLKKLDFGHAAQMPMPGDFDLSMKDVTSDFRAAGEPTPRRLLRVEEQHA